VDFRKGEEKGYWKMQKVFENEVNFTPERRRRRLTTALEP